jgi:hypothetical protein
VFSLDTYLKVTAMPPCAVCHDFNEPNGKPDLSDMEQILETAQQGYVHCLLMRKFAEVISQYLFKKTAFIVWSSSEASKLQLTLVGESEHLSDASDIEVAFQDFFGPTRLRFISLTPF